FFVSTVHADGPGFTVTPILSEDQVSETKSYFDLKVIPKQQVLLRLKINNQTDQKQTYDLSVNTATTNKNGIVDYSFSHFDRDSSMKIALSDCIRLPEKRIVIPENSEKEVSMELDVPEEPFDGILLGGVTITPEVKKNTQGITNVFTRTIAIVVSEKSEKVKPEVEAGKVTVSQENLRNMVQISLRNSTPTLIQGLRANITIKSKDTNKTI
ncbi:WxL protein peptidoglycan domain-containing protein, partial [Enterococcus faecalis]|uniref:DUF916 domain-containing protein n=1 Tax=Enterococcus faecalis TaxID=1351 RepID=UPI003D11B1A8